MPRKVNKLEIENNWAELKNCKISDVQLIPDWEITTTKATETFTDKNTGQVVGYGSSIVKTSVVRLRPEIYYKNLRDDDNAPKKSKK